MRSLYFNFRMLISKVLFWLAEKSLWRGQDEFFTQKEAFSLAKNERYVRERNEQLRSDLTDLKIKIGTYRAYFKQEKDSVFFETVEAFINDIPEEWEPNIKF